MGTIHIDPHAREANRRSESSPEYHGQFGKMFNLPPLNKPSSPADYEDLLARVRNDKNDSGSSGGKASGILAGYTYFGQFIGHDITFSSISDLTRRRNPESILNF